MNCKPGDQAWLLRSVNGNNVGKMCEVLHESITTDRYGFMWLVKFPHPIAWEGGAVRALGYCPDAWLKPHRPGDIHETTDERKEVTV